MHISSLTAMEEKRESAIHLRPTIVTTAQEYPCELHLGPQRIKSHKRVLISNPALQISDLKKKKTNPQTGVTACCN